LIETFVQEYSGKKILKENFRRRLKKVKACLKIFLSFVKVFILVFSYARIIFEREFFLEEGILSKTYLTINF
jgi:hypothetical protein